MAEPSRKPTFSQYDLEPFCHGCGRRLRATEPLWFVGHPRRAVYGLCCWNKAAAA